MQVCSKKGKTLTSDMRSSSQRQKVFQEEICMYFVKKEQRLSLRKALAKNNSKTTLIIIKKFCLSNS